ncbi:MAG: hypothetical protein ISR65_06090 [Bacteriovoracaceae bacterium]|nr:hypothetical protein [Bacteriovoracaceae bacterium]
MKNLISSPHPYMIVLLYLLSTSVLTARSPIGVGNGADTVLSTFEIAQKLVQEKFVAAAKNPRAYLLIPEDRKLFEEKSIEWLGKLMTIEFDSVPSIFELDDESKLKKPKAARNMDGNLVEISKSYYNDHNFTIEQAMVVVIHEAGHKVGITDHDQLDRIGLAIADRKSFLDKYTKLLGMQQLEFNAFRLYLFMNALEQLQVEAFDEKFKRYYEGLPTREKKRWAKIMGTVNNIDEFSAFSGQVAILAFAQIMLVGMFTDSDSLKGLVERRSFAISVGSIAAVDAAFILGASLSSSFDLGQRVESLESAWTILHNDRDDAENFVMGRLDEVITQYLTPLQNLLLITEAQKQTAHAVIKDKMIDYYLYMKARSNKTSLEKRANDENKPGEIKILDILVNEGIIEQKLVTSMKELSSKIAAFNKRFAEESSKQVIGKNAEVMVLAQDVIKVTEVFEEMFEVFVRNGEIKGRTLDSFKEVLSASKASRTNAQLWFHASAVYRNQ